MPCRHVSYVPRHRIEGATRRVQAPKADRAEDMDCLSPRVVFATAPHGATCRVCRGTPLQAPKADRAEDMDWGAPVAKKAEEFDWGAPAAAPA